MDKSITPAISVLMPVYNASAFLRDAIESILNQSFSNFELLLFDDASTDDSVSIMRSFADERIRFFSSDQNKGYVFHLNEGIRQARGIYVARMDADDISEADRFEKQFRFMEDNPEIGICGAQVMTIDEIGNFVSLGHHYSTHDELKIRLLSDSCFAHPLIMMRKSVLVENHLRYNEELVPAEDYALWSELALISKLANLPYLLLRYRIHTKQITKRKSIQRIFSARSTRRRIVERFLEIKLSDEEFEFHNSLFVTEYIYSQEYVRRAKTWILFLLDRNKKRDYYYDKLLFENEMARIWFTLCTHLYSLGPWMIYAYFSLGLKSRSIPKTLRIKFILKSVGSLIFIKKSKMR